MTPLLRIIALALLVVGCAVARAPPDWRSDTPERASLADDGREIAQTQCATCHAISAYGDSPNPRAPLFRTLLSRYHAEVLEQELIEGVRVAHPMPAFRFNPQGVDALIVYLQSIQSPGAAKRAGGSR